MKILNEKIIVSFYYIESIKMLIKQNSTNIPKFC